MRETENLEFITIGVYPCAYLACTVSEGRNRVCGPRSTGPFCTASLSDPRHSHGRVPCTDDCAGSAPCTLTHTLFSGPRRPPLGRVLRVQRRAEFSDLLCTAMHDSIPKSPAQTR